MYRAFVYLHEYRNIDGDFTNHMEVFFDNFDDIAEILRDYNISPNDITIIDFR